MDTIPSNDTSSNPPVYIVYALVDPRDNLPRYIGLTTNIRKRLHDHKWGHGQNPEKEAWLEELKVSGIEVILQPLEEISDIGQAREREIYWIKYYLKRGIVLTNILIAKTPYALFPRTLKPELPMCDLDKHVSYQFQYRKCNKSCCACMQGGKVHGPYWYAYWKENGKIHSRYIGKA